MFLTALMVETQKFIVGAYLQHKSGSVDSTYFSLTDNSGWTVIFLPHSP